MNPKEREKRIKDLRTTIHVQCMLMDSISRKRGENFIELRDLEAETIMNESALEVLENSAA